MPENAVVGVLRDRIRYDGAAPSAADVRRQSVYRGKLRPVGENRALAYAVGAACIRLGLQRFVASSLFNDLLLDTICHWKVLPLPLSKGFQQLSDVFGHLWGLLSDAGSVRTRAPASTFVANTFMHPFV